MFLDEDIRRVGFALVPEQLRPVAKRVYYRLRSHQRQLRRSLQRPIGKPELIVQLARAGAAPGDVICVYSSLAAIGHVHGGASAIIESLCEAVAEMGTVVMPAFAGSAVEIFDRSQAGDMVDLRSEPSRTGLITECFRQMPGVVRSSHPFASTCACGEKSEFISEGHALGERVCHKDSPYARITEMDGKFIGLGTPIFPAGAFAVVEDTCEHFPLDTATPPRIVPYIDARGVRIERPLCSYDHELAHTRIDHPGGAWIRKKLTRHLLRKGILRPFRFGHAASWLMEGKALQEEMEALAARGITIYSSKRQCPAGMLLG